LGCQVALNAASAAGAGPSSWWSMTLTVRRYAGRWPLSIARWC